MDTFNDLSAVDVGRCCNYVPNPKFIDDLYLYNIWWLGIFIAQWDCYSIFSGFMDLNKIISFSFKQFI